MDSSLRVESEGFLSWSEDTGIWLLEELARRPASAVVFAGLERPDDYTDLISADPASLLVPSPSISAPEQAWSKGGEALRIFLQSSYDVFAATDLDGKAWTRKKLAGNVVLIEFWASWCASCKALSPDVARWHRAYASRGLRVIGVAGDPPALAAEAVKQWGIPYPVVADPRDMSAAAYAISALPTVVLVDRAGVVRDVSIGYDPRRRAEIERAIERLLAP